MNFKHVSLLELVECYATENRLIDSEEMLSERFDQMIEVFAPNFPLDDEPALSEEFNNWTDSLCKDGELHDEQYNQYGYVGKHS
jgi:hypothetical protein